MSGMWFVVAPRMDAKKTCGLCAQTIITILGSIEGGRLV